MLATSCAQLRERIGRDELDPKDGAPTWDAGSWFRFGRHGRRPAPPALIAEIEGAIEGAPSGCEVLDPKACLLPFPSNHFTERARVLDRKDGLGPGNPLRIDFAVEHGPVSSSGVVFDPTEWNRNDGFSPGSAMIAYVPGLDPIASALPPITDLAQSLERRSPVVVYDVDARQRVPVWAELDANASTDDKRVLYIRPAVNLEEGHRHVVALRNLVDSTGAPIPATGAFKAHRDRLRTGIPEVDGERRRMERVFRDLRRAGVGRRSLNLAWDFTVASERNLAERMLHIRDDAFASLAGASPRFSVTVNDDPPVGFSSRRIGRLVEGTYEVPNYLTGNGGPGERLNTGPDGLPARNGTITANFVCSIPESVIAGGGAAKPVVYGHGLLGSRYEIYDRDHISIAGDENGLIYCATDTIGMAGEDIGNAATILSNLSRFPTLADRVQQGMLNTLFLARLMIHEGGFVSHPAFHADGVPLIDRTEAYYDGNSQGAIVGGGVTAFAQDWTRAVLGVGGMNYSTLLRRSVDFDVYAAILEPAYPDELDQAIWVSVTQMLWDRAETNGYAHHVGDDPYPRTPPHEVLMHVAIGDYQVAPFTAAILARTIGASVSADPFAPGRTTEVDPLPLLDPITKYPHHGSALFFWDTGTPVPPDVNLPPRAVNGEYRDPHEDPRRQPQVIEQKGAFLQPKGAVIDVCDLGPCIGLPRGELDLDP